MPKQPKNGRSSYPARAERGKELRDDVEDGQPLLYTERDLGTESGAGIAGDRARAPSMPKLAKVTLVIIAISSIYNLSQAISMRGLLRSYSHYTMKGLGKKAAPEATAGGTPSIAWLASFPVRTSTASSLQHFSINCANSVHDRTQAHRTLSS